MKATGKDAGGKKEWPGRKDRGKRKKKKEKGRREKEKEGEKEKKRRVEGRLCKTLKPEEGGCKTGGGRNRKRPGAGLGFALGFA